MTMIDKAAIAAEKEARRTIQYPRTKAKKKTKSK